ncbi:MAG TPA: hypothetical protein VHV10_09690, partial [Ktedonobacteraceae bacterium]|nr:hypothetical protein [Ktedonobacteraceae bacterium]
MNSSSLSKSRIRVAKKLVFLFVLALVALAYVATPVFACGDGGKGNDGKGGGNKAVAASIRQQQRRNRVNNKDKGNKNNNGAGADAGISATTKAITDLQNGLNETFTDSSGATVTLSSLKPGNTFKINFSDGVSLDATLNPDGKSATVTLPDGTTKTVQVDVVNNKVILSNRSLVLVNSDKQTITLLQKGAKSGLQLFKTDGTTPLKLSDLQKIGQKFKIKVKGKLLNAVFLG